MNSDTSPDTNDEHLMAMVTDLVAAYVANNSVPAGDLSSLIRVVHDSLSSLAKTEAGKEIQALKPAVSVRKSIQPDFLVCLEDGKKLKMLKRYLRTKYNLTPEEYRAKWGLAADYPMVAPNYSKQRSNFAKTIGLGRRRKP